MEKFSDIKLGFSDGSEIGKAISENTEVINLSNTQISLEAKESLMTRILEFQCLKSLNLRNLDLGKINSRILTSSLAFIPHLVLSGCLTGKSELLKSILEEIKTKKKVSSIDLSFNNMSAIDEKLLIETFSAMKQLDLTQTGLTREQTKALLSSLSKSGQLKSLNLNDNDVSQVDIAILGDLVTNLRQLSLANSNLQPLQIVELITKGMVINLFLY